MFGGGGCREDVAIDPAQGAGRHHDGDGPTIELVVASDNDTVDGLDRQAGVRERLMQRTGDEQELTAAKLGQVLERETLEQRDAVIADQPLMQGEYGSRRKRQRLDRVIVRAPDGDAALGKP
jgi:hypothetical protein